MTTLRYHPGATFSNISGTVKFKGSVTVTGSTGKIYVGDIDSYDPLLPWNGSVIEDTTGIREDETYTYWPWMYNVLEKDTVKGTYEVYLEVILPGGEKDIMYCGRVIVTKKP